MACAVQLPSVRISLAEELGRPELTVPTHDPVRKAPSQPRPDAQLQPAIDSSVPTLRPFQLASLTPISTHTASRPARPHLTALNERADTPVASSLHLEPTVSPVVEVAERQLNRLTSWGIQSFESFRKAATSKWQWSRASTSSASSSRYSYVDGSNEGSSVQASVSTFTTSSLATSRTSVDASPITVPRNSFDIHLWCKERNIFMGKPKEYPPPSVMNAHWRQNVRDRLIGDIRSALQSLPRCFFEVELYMAGQPDSDTDLVELWPTVVVRCGSKKGIRAVERTVKDLDYLRDFSNGRVVINLNAPRLASRHTSPGVDEQRPERLYAGQPELRVARLATQSACGLPLVYLPDDTGSPRASVVGGLIKVDNIVYGLTTAHSVIELDDHDPNDAEVCWSSDLDSLPGSETTVVPSEVASTLPPLKTAADFTQTLKRYVSPSDSPDVVVFEDHASLASYSYGSKRQPASEANAYSVSEGNDFALIDLPRSYRYLPNVYFNIQPWYRWRTPLHISKVASVDSSCEAVSIVCSPTDVRSAFLLDGNHLFLDQTTAFSTKKLQTQMPLGQSDTHQGDLPADLYTEQGLSGAWVVSGETLLGVIIAIYDDEPYAHMLEITSIFSDVRALMSSGDRVPVISLIDRPNSQTAQDPTVSHAHTMVDLQPSVQIVPQKVEHEWQENSSAKDAATLALNKAQKFLKERLTIVGQRESSDVEKRDPNGIPVSLNNQLVLASVLFAAFTVKLVGL